MNSKWSVAFLLSGHALLLGWLGWTASPNRTEVGHMAATVYFWNTLQFDVFHVNPPLTRMMTSVPVAINRPQYDWDFYSNRPQSRSEWVLGKAFIAANGPEKVRWCFTLARWSLIPLLLLGGFFGYRLSREIYGDASALVFLVIWCFSPYLLAWGATMCPDAVAASLGLVALYAFRRWLRQPSWRQAVIAGACLGLLPLTKTTWIIAFGIWPLIWCLWMLPTRFDRRDEHSRPRPPAGQMAAILLLGLYMLNMGYFFEGTCRPLGKYVFVSQSLHGQEVPEGQWGMPITGNRFADTWLGKMPVPLPTQFVQGIDTQRYDFERGFPSYLRGEWADHGWWYYYLYGLAVKMPLGTWCLMFLAVLATLFRINCNANWRDEMLLLVPFAMVFLVVSSQTGFSANSRYVLPALPLLFVWVSKVGRLLVSRHSLQATLVAFSLSWMIASSLWVYPHCLSYFNELAGGPRNGPAHLLESNIAWGQELYRLEDWYENHTQSRPLHMALSGRYPIGVTRMELAGSPPSSPSGSDSLGSYPVDAIGPQPGWYALSVNEIFGRSRQWRYFLEFDPVAGAGYAIRIYHITPDDANRVRRKLGLPELPDNDAASQGR